MRRDESGSRREPHSTSRRSQVTHSGNALWFADDLLSEPETSTTCWKMETWRQASGFDL